MQLAWNILTTLFARIIVLGLAIISSVILARSLGPEGRGLFALVLLLPELFRSLALLGFEQANAVYTGLEPQGRRTLVWQSISIAVVVGGVLTLAGVCFLVAGAPGFKALAHGPLWMYVLALSLVPSMLVVDYWGAIIRGMNHIVLLNGVEIGTRVVSLISVIVLVWLLHLEVAGAVWADSFIKIGSVVLMIILLRRVGAWGKPSFDRSLWQRTSRFALLAYGGTVTAYLNYRIDEFIIGALLDPEQLGFYVIAVGLVERIWIVTGSVANALLPHLTNSQERDPALPAVVARHVMIWTGVACIAVFLMAQIIVRLLYTSAFDASVSALRWLLPGIFTLSVGKVLVAELHAREKMLYPLWASGIAALVNVVFNLLLVPQIGIVGAAIASSLSYSFLSFAITWGYLRETGVSWTTLVPRWNDLLTYTAFWRHRSTAFALGNELPGK
jgi:O-antigen/teichoic acid export membrane protein